MSTEIPKELQGKIQELQILEQNLQNILLQKQAFQLELNETDLALKELSKSKSDSYKILGNIMVKADNKELTEELEEKKRVINLRIKTMDKQEISLGEKANNLRQELQSKVK